MISIIMTLMAFPFYFMYYFNTSLSSHTRMQQNLFTSFLLKTWVVSNHHCCKNAPVHIMVEVLVAQSCLTFVNPWTVALWAPPSIGLSRQESWSGLSFTSLLQRIFPLRDWNRCPALQTDPVSSFFVNQWVCTAGSFFEHQQSCIMVHAAFCTWICMYRGQISRNGTYSSNITHF